MAVLADLTWQQLAEQLPPNAISVSSNGKLMIDIAAIISAESSSLSTQGVVKFFSIMFSAANKAQTIANESQDNGEKLVAFNPATIGNAVDGYITLTRPFVCRAELATATNIIGTNG